MLLLLLLSLSLLMLLLFSTGRGAPPRRLPTFAWNPWLAAVVNEGVDTRSCPRVTASRGVAPVSSSRNPTFLVFSLLPVLFSRANSSKSRRRVGRFWFVITSFFALPTYRGPT
ncbi:hypothetical protein ACQKWADRAFT_301350 [Trichoderma austrokoningii]